MGSIYTRLGPEWPESKYLGFKNLRCALEEGNSDLTRTFTIPIFCVHLHYFPFLRVLDSEAMPRPKLIVFASGTKDGSSSTTPLGFSKTEYRQENLGDGGSGFENLVAVPNIIVL